MSNLQSLELSGYASEPNVIFLTWTITSQYLYVNQYYTIYYTSNNITNQIISISQNTKLNVIDNTTYNIWVTSLDSNGNTSNDSNEITITTPSISNQHGSRSGLRPFNRGLSYQLNVERICDNQQVISPYPTYIDITKKPFYQYYKIKPCNSC
jgi:hypothetical protein